MKIYTLPQHMNFQLSDEELLIQTSAREFAEKELKPIANKIDKEERVPPELLKKMADLGFLTMLVPSEYGGAGLSNFCLALALIEINKACASTGVTMSVNNSLVTSPLMRFGTEEQKKKYFPRMVKGEIIGAYALTEPVSGSDSASLITTAVKKNGCYILNGSKVFVTNGGTAGLFIIFARTDSSVKQTRGISAFLVEKDQKGLTIGKLEKKLGIRGSSTVQLFFEECEM